jgi:uncharacterized protein (TIGR03067 family)
MFQAFLALCLCACTQAPAAALRGEWRFKSLNIDGERQPLSVATKLRLTLTDNEYIEETAAGKELRRMRLTVYPEDGVLQFDTMGTTFLGRYELKGDTLRIAFPGPIVGNMPRPPDDFAPGDGRTVASWTRDGR